MFTTLMGLQVIYSFVVFILTDPMYYDVDDKDIGPLLSSIGAYSELFVIFADLIIGVIVDIFGRKGILILGELVTAISLGSIPLCDSVYPGFFLCRVSCALGTIVSINIPLLTDYV